MDPLVIPAKVLLHLCELLDSPDTEERVMWLTQDIVSEGVVVFFPDAKARKDYFITMISSVLEDNQPKSWWLKFEALCQYFSKTDSKSLLNLPTNAADVSMWVWSPVVDLSFPHLNSLTSTPSPPTPPTLLCPPPPALLPSPQLPHLPLSFLYPSLLPLSLPPTPPPFLPPPTLPLPLPPTPPPPPEQITYENTEPSLNILNTMMVVAKREVCPALSHAQPFCHSLLACLLAGSILSEQWVYEAARPGQAVECTAGQPTVLVSE